MKTIKIVLITLLFVLSACGTLPNIGGLNSAPATAAPAATEAPVATEESIAGTEAPTLEPTVSPTAMFVPTPLVSNECSVKDTGKKILTNPLREDGALYTWKVSDLPDDLKNCAILWEGRLTSNEEQHHVGILSTGNGVYSTEFDVNNFRHAEASFWVYDPDWDMQSTGNKKASIGEMFVWDKRANMINNVVDPYNWPILFHRIGLDTVLYAKDATMGVTTPSCKILTGPTEISISFAPDYAGPYIASIGSDLCYVAIKDLEWGIYQGAVDDYQINNVETFMVVMFPYGTTIDEVQTWIDSQ